MLTAKKFAERAGVTYPTVIAWLKKGLIPDAKKCEDPTFGIYWEIPATSLDHVKKQKTGPKPGAKRKAKKKAPTRGKRIGKGTGRNQ